MKEPVHQLLPRPECQNGLTVRSKQESAVDPFDPVDNKEMLAQMAQFSSLAGVSDINTALAGISGKLDAILAAQTAAAARPGADPA